jgi:hypothetical protein
MGVMEVDNVTGKLWDEIQADANLGPVAGLRAMEILCDPQGNLFILDTCNGAHCVNQSKWVGVPLDDWAGARLGLLRDVANAAERLHVAINLAEENHDAWNGKGSTPPSHEVQQKLSAECVAADEGLTTALAKLRASK